MDVFIPWNRVCIKTTHNDLDTWQPTMTVSISIVVCREKKEKNSNQGDTTRHRVQTGCGKPYSHIGIKLAAMAVVGTTPEKLNSRKPYRIGVDIM